MNKIIYWVWFIIWLTIIWVIGYLIQQKQNECFDRLAQIQSRLIEISSQKNQLEMDITAKKQQISELEYEEAGLNDEALNLFNNFIKNSDNDTVEKEKLQWLLLEDENWNEWTPWQLTKDWSNQVMPPTTWDDSHERFKSLSNAYGLNPSAIREVENHYGIKEGVILCITIAETSWGKFGAGENNIGNVWNTDSNPRWNSYSNIWASLDAIGRTLTNRYLWKKQTLGCLSNRHHCEEVNDNGARYATSSPETSGAREPNMVTCLETIYGKWKVDPSTFSIRR